MKKSILAMCLVASTVMPYGVAQASENPFIVKSTKEHKITLLNHGMASLEERLQMIERAQESIDVEYFIYRTDRSAKLLTQALVRKARQGVKVRILLDYFVVKRDFTNFYVHELEKSGVIFKYYNTTSLLNVSGAQYRNHRKVIIIDGKEAITGGRNIGDEYFDLHADYTFLDRDIVVEGELVTQIKETFDRTFNSEMSTRVSREKMPNIKESRYTRRDDVNTASFNMDLRIWNKKVEEAKSFIETPMDSDLESKIRANGQMELSRVYKGVCNEITFRSEYPDLGRKNRKTNRIVKHDIFDRIDNAKESIVMESPYFIVNDELGARMAGALKRNVSIKGLTNSLHSSDAVYVYAAFDSIIPKWLKKGLDSYIFIGSKPESYGVVEEFSGGARFGVHAKTMIFDHKDVIVGTYNVDPRSANYNSEMTITCENNRELADAVQEDIDSRMNASINLTSQEKIKQAEFHQISFGKKILYYLSKGISHGFGHLL